MSPRPIGEIVAKQLPACVVGFDPETFEVDYHRSPVGTRVRRTGSSRSASRRADRCGSPPVTTSSRWAATARSQKLRSGELQPGTMVALPRRIPTRARSREHCGSWTSCPRRCTTASRFRDRASGARSRAALADQRGAARGRLEAHRLLPRRAGGSRWRRPARARTARRRSDRTTDRSRAANSGLPAVLPVDAEIAWLLGIYVAEGSAGATSSRSPTRTRRTSTGRKPRSRQLGSSGLACADRDHVLLVGRERAVRLARHR